MRNPPAIERDFSYPEVAQLYQFHQRAAHLRGLVKAVSGVALVLGALMLFGCGGGSMSGGSRADSSSTPLARCNTGGPEDLAGQCRNTPATMGALEAGDGAGSASASAASLSVPHATSRSLQVTWQPLADNVNGYMVYFGKTAETASVLVSTLPTNAGLFDPRAPAVTYDASRDLGLYAGDTACFRIYAFDVTQSLSNQSTLVCTVV